MLTAKSSIQKFPIYGWAPANLSIKLKTPSLLERLDPLLIEGKAVLPPQAAVLVALLHTRRPVAVGVVFAALNGLDELRLLHPVWIDPHTFCHVPDVVIFHKSLSGRLEINTVERCDGRCMVACKAKLEGTAVDLGQVMLKHACPKRMDMRQTIGMNDDPVGAEAISLEDVEDLGSRCVVKIAHELEMERVTVPRREDPEVGSHFVSLLCSIVSPPDAFCLR
jgi:hypothetical protein